MIDTLLRPWFLTSIHATSLTKNSEHVFYHYGNHWPFVLAKIDRFPNSFFAGTFPYTGDTSKYL